ncbi:MAG: DUF2167 domain-containing protein [Clostridiaceae bacterium]
MKKFITILLTAILITLNIQISEAASMPKIHWTAGPSTIDVGDNIAKLNLPKDYYFANGEDTRKYMEYLNNPISNKEQGMVISNNPTINWYILFEFNDVGYVKETASKDLDSERLLVGIRKEIETINKERKEKGSYEAKVVGWDEKPNYDTTTNTLTWSVLLEANGSQFVNYNVRILGRYGYTSVVLVTSKKDLEKIRPELNLIINNYTYIEGKKYTDFVEGEDVISEKGFINLITKEPDLEILDSILLEFKKYWPLVAIILSLITLMIISFILGFIRRKREERFDKSYMNPTYDYTKNNSAMDDDYYKD